MNPETSTQTPEARASELLSVLMDAIFHDGLPLSEMEALISQALRQAEDAAYERAAAIASSMDQDDNCIGSSTARVIAEEIRALKSEQGT